MYQHILLTLDSSHLAEQAIPHAENLASAAGARLTLLSCVEPYVIGLPTAPSVAPMYDIDTDIESTVAEREDYMNGIKEMLAARGLKVSVVVLRGRPADEILHYAASNAVDVIVMTTHGRSGFGKFIYGSVTDRVLHGAHTPVMLIRATE
jgi:nucleotide-binding universal stress UspA family protein